MKARVRAWQMRSPGSLTVHDAQGLLSAMPPSRTGSGVDEGVEAPRGGSDIGR